MSAFVLSLCRHMNSLATPKKTTNASTSAKHLFSGKCFYCGKLGHRITKCCNQKAAEKNGKKMSKLNLHLTVLIELMIIICAHQRKTIVAFTKNTWIMDSGASCFIYDSNYGMFEIMKLCREAKVQ